MEINYQTTLNNLFSDLTKRRKEILDRRFGLRGGQAETLQSIGDNLGITRERVRQLVNDSLNIIQERQGKQLKRPIDYFIDYFQEQGGLKSEEKIFEELAPRRFRGYVAFFLTIGPTFERFNESQDYYTFWSIDRKIVGQAKKIINLTIKRLDKKREPISFKELKTLAADNLAERVFLSYIEVSKPISQSPEGLFGLTAWPDINPKGVRDRAYLVLKKQNGPLHFVEITKQINNLPFEKKDVLSESVHNELIRSPLFVLIGRGIYALREWGYEPGTVREIIVQTLKQAKKPLLKGEVIKKVLAQRKVQENTILLNLQDKDYFIKTEEGKFWLK